MRKKFQRGLAIFLCVVMAFSCAVVPAGAVAPAIVAVAKVVGPFVASWLGGKVLDQSLQLLKDWVNGGTDTDGLIATVGFLRTAQKTEVTEERLRELAYEWNITCSDAVGFTVDVVDYSLDTGEVYRVIAVRRGYVVISSPVQYCLADGVGRILYCDATLETSGRWSPEEDTSGRHLLNYNALFNLSQEVGGLLRLKDNWYEIYNRNGELYCNVAGRRFSCIYESKNAAISQDRPTTGGTVIEGDTTNNIDNTTNNYDQSVNIEDQTQILPGGVQNVIDNVIYDDNTKTYYIDSHDTTNNVTNNYLYQYHINYTSITYIGQSEEYNKRYELYYQLPDGRDSADLTREELEQLNVDIDVIPYLRSTDNVDVRSLYHFDGDTRDSSYWNYITKFQWINGASLTYMESGAFNGALYLDENQHAFRLTMKEAADTAGDWTLQWRYYQSHTEAPVNDSSVYVGDKPVLTMDGSAFYTPAGDQITVIPTGSWNEVCIIRTRGFLFYYVNGVWYKTVEDPHYRSGDIRFVFGRDQQTFKYFDELRFSRGSLYFAGANYTPTSVPHDSNLTLILPNGKDVVVDEVAVLTPSDNNLLTPYKRDNWGADNNFISGLERDVSPFYPYTEYITKASAYSYSPAWTGYPIVYDRDLVTTTLSSSNSPRYRRIRFGGTSTVVKQSPEASYYRQPWNSIAMPLFCLVNDGADDRPYSVSDSSSFGYSPGKVYTLSVVLADCTYSSITFRILKTAGENGWVDEPPYVCEVLSIDQSSEIQFFIEDNLGLVASGYEESTDYTFPVTAICWNSVDGDSNVFHMELVEGSSHEFQIDYDTAVYDEVQLTHAPTLAVRTDVTITDYQIGGVRPSVPQKGQVWALVESGYITSLQVYTGSVWLNCDGRIWTGERWIPASSYNVITLQDMFDIVDATQDYEYIYTESGFWSWLQNAWKDMISRLDKIIEGLGSKKGNSLDGCDHVYDVTGQDDSSCSSHARKTYSCSGCGDVYIELIDPLGHQWPIDPHSAAILVQPQDVTAPVSTVAKFAVIAVGDGLIYQWQYRVASGSGWSNSSGGSSSVLLVDVLTYRDGYQYRCKVTDSNGRTVISDAAVLTVGNLSQPSYVSPSYNCNRCGVTGEVYEGGIVSSDGVPEDAFTFDDLLLDSFDGIWTIVTGFVTTGYGGLSGFVESFSLLPGFFHFYRPVSICGGGDIWD